MRPYLSIRVDESVEIRTFLASVPEEELQWHWDEEDRIIEALNESGWSFQFDNELPIPFDAEIYIKAGQIHRVIKGDTDLVLKVTKLFASEG